MSSTEPDPIPVRALTQVTYCPRLDFPAYVDCVMPTNEHVETCQTCRRGRANRK